MTWGRAREPWDPLQYLDEHFPEVRVEYGLLKGRLQGCLERDKGIIWLDVRLSPAEARSTLAYELGLLHQPPTPTDPCLAAGYQRAAVDWAARKLIPSDLFAAVWANCLDLAAMADYCGVDLPMFRARIRAASDADQDAVMEAITGTRLSA